MNRLYRLVLRAFPAAHRTAYGDEMLDAFVRAYAYRRRAGRWQALSFVIAACLDAVRAGLGERRRRSRRTASGRPALGHIGRDLAHAVRSLAKARGFSFVAIVSLGIGLGTVITILLVLRMIGVSDDLVGAYMGPAAPQLFVPLAAAAPSFAQRRRRATPGTALLDAVKLAAWGVGGGLALAFLWERETSWSSVGGVESLAYIAAVAIAFGVAMLASIPAARRAAAVEPIIAMRAE